jgi:hypothetical protein
VGGSLERQKKKNEEVRGSLEKKGVLYETLEGGAIL